MQIHPQPTPERSKLAELIADYEIGMLTFADANGTLISQPMAALEMDEHGAIWFFTDNSSEKTRYLDRLNLAFSGESDGVYVSLSGYGELDDSASRKNALWTAFAEPWFPQGPASPTLSLLRFMPYQAEYWDAPHSKVIRLFAMAASIAASRPIGLGEHARLTPL